jgi:hypothetical protein
MTTFLAAVAAANPAGGAAAKEVIGATTGAAIATTLLFGLGLGHRAGRTELLERWSAFAARVGGLPKWVALPSAIGTVSLLTALLGMYWDISLHIDQGRDPGPLANPAHYLILFGLFGIFAAGFLSMAIPREKPCPTALRVYGDWYTPLGGLLMAGAGGFALIGFPLDDMWHRLFGQDVTLWGPTHLMLIGGASISLIGQGVLLAEGTRAQGGRESRTGAPSWIVGFRRAALAGGFLIGLSTFQAEFDFGVPQFDFLFQPMLIALAASIGLVSARLWGGRGAALGAIAFFCAVRGGVTLMVHDVWGEALPHFPLYLAEAVLVEATAAAVLARRGPLVFGAVAGLLIGTVGTAAEWAWSHVWMPLPWPSSLLPSVAAVTVLAGLAGGLVGAFIGGTLRVKAQPFPRGARVVYPLAGLAVAALVAFGLWTSPAQGVSARVQLYELPDHGTTRHVSATVSIDPPQAADDAKWLTTTAWQGGGLVVDRLERVREGVYRTHDPVPVSGEWKSEFRLHKGRSLIGVPIYMPNDPAIPAKGVPATSSFERPFVRDKQILQREAKPGALGLWVIAYGIVLAITLSIIAFNAWALVRLATVVDEPAPARTPRRVPAAGSLQPA